MNYKIKLLEDKIKEALNTLGYMLDEVTINPSNRPELGDYQFNGVMPLAKKNNQNPVEVAHNLVAILKTYPELKDVSVAGPGFINLTFRLWWS